MKNPSPTDYLHGAVLLLEPHDTPDILRPKFAAMRDMGLNTTVVWPPAFYVGGRRDYAVQRAALDAAGEAGLRVIVELTGQVPNLEYLPDCDWNPEWMCQDTAGRPVLMAGGLGGQNYNHPEVASRLRAFFEETARALGDHPALFAWDVWNETHFQSYDPWTIAEFRKWLRGKYGDIAALNDAWKKSYTDFGQIRHDPVTWASVAPDSDWEEFRTDNLVGHARAWTAVLHAADPAHPVIADNVMSQAAWSEFGRGTDDWKLAGAVDRFGISFYPKTGGRLLKVNEPWLRALCFAGARSAGGGRFYVSEMQSHCYSEIFTRERVSPDDLLDWNLEALFQGCAGNIYWKWNPFKSGFQAGGRGLVLADGTPSRRADAVARFSRLLAEHPEMQSLRPVAAAAILFDRTTNIVVKAVNNRVRGMIGDDQPARARCGLARSAWPRNVALSVVTPGQIASGGDALAGVRLLALPYQVVLSDALAASLRAFMEGGGTIVANYPFGDIAPNGRLYDDLPGGPLSSLLGVRQIDNVEDAYRGEPLELQELEFRGAPDFHPDVLLETDGGRPLLLRRAVGRGALFYCASPVWLEAFDAGAAALANTVWDALLAHLAATAPEALPHGASLPAMRADSAAHTYLFIENSEGAPFCDIALPPGSGEPELIFGEGALERRSGSTWRIASPRHAVLRHRRDA